MSLDTTKTGNLQAGDSPHSPSLEATLPESIFSEKLFRQLAEIAQEGICLINDQALITYVNERMAEIVGYTSAEMLGQPLLSFFDEEAQKVLSHHHALRKMGVSEHYELSFRDRTDQNHWVSVVSSPVFNEKEQYIATMALVSDITKRKLAEQALKESEARFRTVIESAPIGIAFNRQELSIFENRRYLEMFGYQDSSEVTNHPLIELIAPQCREEVLERVRRRWLGEDVPIEYETIGLRRDGSQFPFSVFVTKMNFPDGPASVIFFWDITERKEAEIKLREAERFARSTLNALSAHIAILDEDGTILAVNDAWSRFVENDPNFPEPISVGVNYLKTLEAQDSDSEKGAITQALLKGIRQVLNGETSLFSYEYPYHTPYEKRWFEARITRFMGEGPTRVVMSHQIITERVLATELLAQQKYELTQRVKELDCLYNHGKLMEDKSVSLETLFQDTVNLMPPAWQYPDITCARLMIEDQVYTSSNFMETSWQQVSPVIIDQKQIGVLEVFYKEERPKEFEGPFLEEERKLINELTRRLGHKIETFKAEAALQMAHATLEEKVIKRTAELQAAKELFEAILNSSVDGILLLQSNLTIQATNTAFNKLFGGPPQVFVNLSLSDLFYQAQSDQTVEPIQLDLKNGENLYTTVRAVRLDGSTFEAELGFGPIQDRGFVCVIRDITERKQAEAALKQRNTALMNLHAGALEIAAVLDIPTLLDRILRRAVDLLNADRGGGIYLHNSEKNNLTLQTVAGINEGRKGSILQPEEGVAGRVLKTGQSLIVNDYTQWEGHAKILVHEPSSAVMGVPLVIQKQVVGVLLVIANSQDRTFISDDLYLAEMFAAQASTALHNAQLYDAAQREISDRKRAEEALRESEEKFRLLLDGAPIATVISDRTGRIVLVNRRAEALFGYDRTELVGEMVEILLPAYAVGKHSGSGSTVISLPDMAQEGVTGELYGRHKDNHEFPVDIELSYLETPAELLVMSFIQDITERKLTEKAMQQALAREKELSELKSRFVSMASHELRNPLTAILATSETLTAYRHKLNDEQINIRLNRIRDSVLNMKDITENVLQLTRHQTGRINFTPSRSDLNLLCCKIFEELESQEEYRGRIVYECSNVPLIAYFDARLMRQVIGNLVSNALKYSPREKFVYVNLMVDSQKLVLKVQDEGIGIPPEDLNHLFEPFHRANNVGAISGTGLGLSIARQAIELHGGTITPISQLGRGTTFTVTFPLMPEEDENHE